MVRDGGGKLIADKLNGLLEAKGWKPSDLIDRSGLKQASVYEWLKGGKEPRANGLMALARALEVSADYLLGLDPTYDGLPAVQVAARESLRLCLRDLGIGPEEPKYQLYQKLAASGAAPRTVEQWKGLITGLLPIALEHERLKLGIIEPGKRRSVIPLNAKPMLSKQKSSGRRLQKKT